MRRVTIALLAATVLTGPAFAEEIIYFKNGTTMPIRSHNVEGDLVHVDMGSDALMAFPISQVERIVAAGRDIVLRPSTRPANVGVSGGVVKVDIRNDDDTYPVIATRPATRSVADGSVVEAKPADANGVVSMGGIGQVPPGTAPAARPSRRGRLTGNTAAFRRAADGSVQIGGKTTMFVGSRSRVHSKGDRSLMWVAARPELVSRGGEPGEPADAPGAVQGASGAEQDGSGN